MYKVIRDKNNGQFRYVLRIADDYRIGRHDPNFAEFQTWNSQQVTPESMEQYEFPDGHETFHEVKPLVEYCCKRGVTLSAGIQPDGVILVTRSGPINFPYKGELYNLQEARAVQPGVIDGNEFDGLVPGPSAIWVDQEMIEEKMVAASTACDELRKVCSCRIDRTFAFLDISDFSKYVAGHEALIVNSLVRAVNSEEYWTGYVARLYRSFEAMLCIGDGYIFVFKDPVMGTYFAAYLAVLLEILVANQQLPVAFHFRIGVHVGPVYTFWDPGRKDWNYIGDGINGGSRVLAAVGKDTDDVMYVSGQVREAILALNMGGPPHARLIDNMHNRGRKADKHGNPWRVYEVNHTALCRKDIPTLAALVRARHKAGG